jgi:hypothetical protein
MAKDTKQRLFEMMGRLDPSFNKKLLTEDKKTTKKKLNEYYGDNYPPGAANDPNAPWNQVDDSLDYVETYVDNRYPNTFEVIAHSADGSGKLERDGWEMVDEILDYYGDNYEIDPKIKPVIDYFEQFRNGGLTKELSNSREFNEMGRKLWDWVYAKRDFEWEYPEQDYDERDYDER